ncbi:MAG TPA: sigma 54-interacting transcriptional regulator [Terracidiphilus sp.]|nr:sigma 54-interacting transcriptional regulator [Terracidiphilus sp.]
MEPRFRRAIAGLAEGDFPILIAGEAGVGKRSVAELIHAHSHRARSAFQEIRAAECTAAELLAVLSARGTVYLSEVGNLSAPLQELLVEKYFGSKEAQASRLLCGTSRELQDEVKSRRMKESFLHLISTVTYRIAPLRFRKSELLSMADELLSQYSRQFDRPKPVLSQESIGFLLKHQWPGNLTELQTAIKTFVAIGDESVSLAALKAAAPAIKLSGLRRPLSLKQATRAASIEVERQLISEMLAATGGNRKRAADELGISYKALLYKLKQVDTAAQPSSNGNGVGL